MSDIRRIMTHVDSSEPSMARLKTAHDIAVWQDADVQAVYAVTPWLWLYPSADMISADWAAAYSDWDRERMEQAKARFDRARQDFPRAQWAEIHSPSPYDLGKRAAYADLVVMGAPHGGDDAVPGDFTASIAISSGRPVLVVPKACTFQAPPKSVLLAWNGSREAARALSSAWAWIGPSTTVHVAIWPSDNAEPGADMGGDIESYLKAHGLQPTVHRHSEPSKDVGQSLLALASTLGAELLIMGCYGHNRAWEWVLGGATRTVLYNATLPVLLAH